jgi:hypothetical protein
MLAPSIHPWAQDDLKRLRASGITPDDNEVAWLARLAARAHETPGRESDVDRTSPMVFAGVKFWPLTLKAESWFARWYSAFDGNPKVCVAIQLYAHAHSKPGDATLDDLGDPNRIADTVCDWFERLPIREDQLLELQRRIIGMTADSESVPKFCGATDARVVPSTIEDRIAALCSLFEGTTPEYWRSDVSAASAYAMAAAKQARENGDAWANSPERTRRIADYLNAVKWVASRSLGNG